MKTTFIYGLKLKNNNEVRYIGKSDNPNKRLKKHIYNTKLKIKQGKKLTFKENWLLKHDFNIEYIILEECDYSIWKDVEIKYIKNYNNLTNTSSGGEGGAGIFYKFSYDEAKTWVHNNLKIKSKNDWVNYIKTNKLPLFISPYPYTVYKTRGWVSWGDFLGTNNKWDNDVNYLNYELAKSLIKELKISNKDAYIKLFNQNLIPNNIPRRPDRYYKTRGWVSWGDFLGTNFVANQFRVFYSYKEFKEKILELGISSFTDFKKFIKSNKDDIKIPTNPNVVYKNTGWVSWNLIIKE